MSEFEQELRSLINRHSQENGSNTPDFILARYLNGCLRLFNATVSQRSDWYGRHDGPGGLRVPTSDRNPSLDTHLIHEEGEK